MATLSQSRHLRAPTSSEPVSVHPQYSLAQLVVLHLMPGAIFTGFLILAAPALDGWGIDPSFALFGGIGLVLVPLELSYLALYAHRTTGSWSPLAAVDYTERLPTRRLAMLAGALAAWFLLCLVLSVALFEESFINSALSWMPDSLLQFSVVEDDASSPGRWELIALLLVALAFNGLAGPITEELYFRGHLLPHLARYGRWAPVVNTTLFAFYHFFSPWRYPAIIVGFLPITWMAWRRRSIYVSMAAHMTINTITVLSLAAA